ncbi:MAG: DUF3575 domain-containing protein [Bacteroidota bacterium]
MLKLRLLFCVLLVGTLSDAAAQVSGYLGKRLVVKTDLVDYWSFEGGYNVQAEYLFARRHSLQCEFQTKEIGYDNYLNRSIQGIRYDTDDPAQVNSWEGVIALRHYLSRALPAPKGLYAYQQFAFGEADISGNYVFDNFENFDYKVADADYWSVELGWGYQTFLLGRIAIDVGFGFNYSELDAGEFNLVLEDIRYRHGSNLIQLEERLQFFGLSAHLGVGCLLF